MNLIIFLIVYEICQNTKKLFKKVRFNRMIFLLDVLNLKVIINHFFDKTILNKDSVYIFFLRI